MGKNNSRAFLTLIGISSASLIVTAAVVAVLFRAEGVPVWSPVLGVGLGGLLFLVGVFALLAPLRSAYSYDFASCVDPEDEGEPGGFRASLEALGAAPLLALIRMFALVLVGVTVASVFGLGMGLTGPATIEFGLLLLSFGMLAASFTYVIADRLALRTLLSASLTCYPVTLRENRQQRKIFIIPVFMSLMSLVFAFSTAFLLSDRGPIPELGVLGSIGVLSGLYLTVVVVLVGNWNANTALLYQSVLVQLDHLTQAERDLTKRISIGSVDEIGSISGRVNSFCEGLSDGLREVAVTHGELATVQQSLYCGIDTASGAAGDIATSITAALAAIERADTALADSWTNARELAVHTAGVTVKIEEQAARVASSTTGIQSMMEAVRRLTGEVSGAQAQTDDLTRVVHGGEEGLRSLVETVKAVSARSTDLEKVNKLIAAVAARTNLLAMNAAIEAAHAGDAGRGFSVVAEEIRTLAESTAEYTRHSRQSLTSILALIQEALVAAQLAGDSFGKVQRATEAVSKVTAGVSAAMGSEERRSAQILTLLAETEDLGRSIGETTKALDLLAGTMADRLKSASGDQSEARNLAQTMTNRNTDLTEAMGQVTSLSEKTAEINHRLAAFLTSFRT